MIFVAFLVSLIATLGSLFFSEIMNFVPCSLCWYQRIFMYPLVFIFLTNLLYPDKSVFKYSFPLVFIGLIISIYHNLLIYFKCIVKKCWILAKIPIMRVKQIIEMKNHFITCFSQILFFFFLTNYHLFS